MVDGLHESTEDELRALLKTFAKEDVAKIRAVLTNLATPRGEANVSADAEPKKAEPVAEGGDKPAGPAAGEEVKATTKLTEEQIKNIREALDVIDSDKSGAIEASELKVVLKALDVTLDDAQADEVFKSIDTEKTKKIEFDGYLKLVEAALAKCSSA